MTTESEIQKDILDLLAAHGYYAANIIVASKAGVPDILACIEGFFVGLEVKKPNDKINNRKLPSPLQAYNISKIHKAGGFGYVVQSVVDVDKIIVHLRALALSML